MISRHQILITVDELHQRLGSDHLKILHVQMDPVGASVASSESSPTNYIPGAIVFNIEQISDHQQDLPHMMPSEADFQKIIRSMGIDQNDEIVVYDEKGIYSSPRARYMFLSMGHTRVKVLDGGLPAWIQSGFSVVDHPRSNSGVGTFIAKNREHAWIDRKAVLQNIKTAQLPVLDARSEDRFHGRVDEPRPGLRRGHVPGSRSLAFTRVLNGVRMKSDQDLRDLFESYSIGDSAVFYCGSGVTACISALGAEIAGIKHIQIYDGSWSEWGRDPELPIE
jgi:thiosulfate/3-mercaptopyruvate sulfurtransferase